MPWVRLADGDAELFMQFTPERGIDALARFELAARELPIAGIHLARGPRSQQEAAFVARGIALDENAHGHIDRRSAVQSRCLRRNTLIHADAPRSASRPLKSLAN